ncbi:hypothetical protein FWC31_01390 [Candidatus Saccharibacteria bacterium]|nr:hypothetical protein [Candidatus Saccharibacteria bacterium]
MTNYEQAGRTGSPEGPVDLPGDASTERAALEGLAQDAIRQGFNSMEAYQEALALINSSLEATAAYCAWQSTRQGRTATLREYMDYLDQQPVA